MKTLVSAALMALFLLSNQAVTAAEPPQQLFDKVSAAYGAKAPAGLRETGTTTSFSRGEGTLIRLFKAPDRFRSEITYASGQEVRTMVGPVAWQQSKPANPALRGAIALQAARVALPWNMLAKWSAATDLGSETMDDGKALQTLEFQLGPLLKLVIHIDADTGYIVRSRGIMQFGERTMEFATRYSDFRSDGGRTYAAREEQFAMGQHIGYSVIQKVEYLDTVADSDFAPWVVVQREPRPQSGATALAAWH